MHHQPDKLCIHFTRLFSSLLSVNWLVLKVFFKDETLQSFPKGELESTDWDDFTSSIERCGERNIVFFVVVEVDDAHWREEVVSVCFSSIRLLINCFYRLQRRKRKTTLTSSVVDEKLSKTWKWSFFHLERNMYGISFCQSFFLLHSTSWSWNITNNIFC